MRTYVLVLFFLGIIMTIIGYYEGTTNSLKTKTIYKYVDSTLEEAQKGGQPSVFNNFVTMFSDPPILI
jgi:hypothetical protein